MHPLIKYLHTNGSKILAGNEKRFEVIEFSDGKYIHTGEDLAGKGEFKLELNELQAQELLMNYFEDKCLKENRPVPKVPEGWEVFLKNNWSL